jgi:hypothetical protein
MSRDQRIVTLPGLHVHENPEAAHGHPLHVERHGSFIAFAMRGSFITFALMRSRDARDL